MIPKSFLLLLLLGPWLLQASMVKQKEHLTKLASALEQLDQQMPQVDKDFTISVAEEEEIVEKEHEKEPIPQPIKPPATIETIEFDEPQPLEYEPFDIKKPQIKPDEPFAINVTEDVEKPLDKDLNPQQEIVTTLINESFSKRFLEPSQDKKDKLIEVILKGDASTEEPIKMGYTHSIDAELAGQITSKTPKEKAPLLAVIGIKNALEDETKTAVLDKVLSDKKLSDAITPEVIAQGLMSSTEVTQFGKSRLTSLFTKLGTKLTKKTQDGNTVLHLVAKQLKDNAKKSFTCAYTANTVIELAKIVDPEQKNDAGKTATDTINEINQDELSFSGDTNALTQIKDNMEPDLERLITYYTYEEKDEKRKLLSARIEKTFRKGGDLPSLPPEKAKILMNALEQTYNGVPLTEAQFIPLLDFAKQQNLYKIPAKLDLSQIPFKTTLNKIMGLIDANSPLAPTLINHLSEQLKKGDPETGDSIFAAIISNTAEEQKMLSSLQAFTDLFQDPEPLIKKKNKNNVSAEDMANAIITNNKYSGISKGLEYWLHDVTKKTTTPKSTPLIIKKPTPKGSVTTTTKIDIVVDPQWGKNIIDYQIMLNKRYLENPQAILAPYLRSFKFNKIPIFQLIDEKKLIWPVGKAQRTEIPKIDISGLFKNDLAKKRKMFEYDALYHLMGRINPALISKDMVENNWHQRWAQNEQPSNLFDEVIKIYKTPSFFGTEQGAREAIKRGWVLALETADAAVGLITYYLVDAIKGQGAFNPKAAATLKENVVEDFNNAKKFFFQAEDWITYFENQGDGIDQQFVNLLKQKRTYVLDILIEIHKDNTVNDQLKKAGIELASFIQVATTWSEEDKNRRWCLSDWLVEGDQHKGLKGLTPANRQSIDLSLASTETCELDLKEDFYKTSYFQAGTGDMLIIKCKIDQYQSLLKKLTSTTLPSAQKSNLETERIGLIHSILKTINTFVGYLLDSIDNTNRKNFEGWLKNRGYRIAADDEILYNYQGTGVYVSTITSRVCPMCFEDDIEENANLKKEREKDKITAETFKAMDNFIASIKDADLEQTKKKAHISITLIKIFWMLVTEDDDATKWDLPDLVTAPDPVTRIETSYPIDIDQIKNDWVNFKGWHKVAHFMRDKNKFPLGEAWRKMR